ncbi:MAG TPA: hypothetical protein PKY96_07935, partial [Flavobacteriales bacterium]|nr:hypothetical protein [Flavobacteriales bacterium]
MGSYANHTDAQLHQERKKLERDIATMAEKIEKAEDDLIEIAKKIDALPEGEMTKRMSLEAQREEKNNALENWSNQRNEFQK